MRIVVKVQIGELELRKTELERMEIRHELGEHSRCHLEFIRDRATDLSLDTLLAQPISVVLEDETTEEVAFSGTVVRGSQAHLLNYGSRFTLEAASVSHVMGAHRSHRYFPNASLDDIASTLGVQVAGTPLPSKPLNYVQYGESDFDFLRRIADDHGCYVRPLAEGVEIRAGFNELTTELKWGRDLLSVTAEVEPSNPGFKGAFYDAAEKKDHRFHGVRRSPEWLGGAQRLTSVARDVSTRFAGGGDPNVPEVPSRTPTMADFKSLLERESERAIGRSIRVQGSSTNIALLPGNRVDIQSSLAFELPTDGVLGLIAVIHTFDGQQYTNEFIATPWARFCNRTPPEPRPVRGVRAATVVDNEDPSLQGRVRVRYHWQDDGHRTGWARLAAPYAGNGRGFLFTPEVGDEVVIAFESGDPERPYVLGALWNGKDQVPEPVDGNAGKCIRTRSGNTLRLVDTEGAERIDIFSARGDCMLQLATDVDGKPTITIHSQGDLSLEAQGEIRMSCATLTQVVGEDARTAIGGDREIRVEGKLTAQACADLELRAECDAILSAGAALHANASANAHVTGGQVQMNPPGYSAPEVDVEATEVADSAWQEETVPVEVAGRSTSDPPTPRVTA